MTFLSKVLIIVDPPEHTRLRRIVGSAFSPARIQRLEPVIVELVDGMLLGVADQRSPDLVPALVSPLPITIIRELLGLHADRRGWLHHISDEIATIFSPFRRMDPAQVDVAVAELSSYTGELADERRARPCDDLLTALVRAEDDDGRLSREELVTMVEMLVFAGHETTDGLLAPRSWRSPRTLISERCCAPTRRSGRTPSRKTDPLRHLRAGGPAPSGRGHRDRGRDDPQGVEHLRGARRRQP